MSERNVIDVIIPTCKTLAEVQPQIDEIYRTAGCPVRVIATCQPICAAKNRNLGLDASESDPVFMVDDDCSKFPQGWVKDMTEAIMARPNCVMLSARLMKPNGQYGFMMGCRDRGETGVVVSAERRLCTACIALRRSPMRFDEQFQGSGFEDNDASYQLWLMFPDCEFCVILDIRVTHLNEMKRQLEFWPQNKRYIIQKWGHT